ncbi:hypothetical protein M084_4179 [Bacteroides fragilis str. 3988 T1]|nr:hypothetical protein M084_4179 [Bacteroides fragilis str. 3988 T1]
MYFAYNQLNELLFLYKKPLISCSATTANYQNPLSIPTR